jgi:hypothetical protein
MLSVPKKMIQSPVVLLISGHVFQIAIYRRIQILAANQFWQIVDADHFIYRTGINSFQFGVNP